jgi:hypothetical protein
VWTKIHGCRYLLLGFLALGVFVGFVVVKSIGSSTSTICNFAAWGKVNRRSQLAAKYEQAKELWEQYRAKGGFAPIDPFLAILGPPDETGRVMSDSSVGLWNDGQDSVAMVVTGWNDGIVIGLSLKTSPVTANTQSRDDDLTCISVVLATLVCGLIAMRTVDRARKRMGRMAPCA